MAYSTYEAKYPYNVKISGVGTATGVIASTIWEAIDKIFWKYKDLQPDRKKYSALRVRQKRKKQ